MKAIVVRAFGGPEVLRVETLPDPAPAQGRVVVALKAVGVNPVETYVRSGKYPRVPPLPWVPGSDAAGVVEAVSAGVGGVKAGDRVYLYAYGAGSPGVYAEKAAVEPWRAFPLPDGVSFEQGAAVGVPYGTAHRALFGRAAAKKGETVLIHGASGGVGVAAVQLARAAGLTVFGTGGGPDGAAFVKSLGAHHALDHRAPGYQDEISRLTGGKGVDVIVEMLANVNLPADLALAAPRGRIVVVGSRGPVAVDPRGVMMKDLAVLGMTMSNVSDADRAAIHAELGRGLRDGSLKPVIGRSFPLADAAKAHAAVMEPGARGKIVLIP
ncbi:MAG: NADPH:quinone reductase [Elusimicrobia bacterium]|nr:NADPH:quinone reductase [Elusimicrobiota bacterium]